MTFTDNGTTTLGSSALSTTAGVTTASILVHRVFPLAATPSLPPISEAPASWGVPPPPQATVTVSQAATKPRPRHLGEPPPPTGQSVTLTATVLPTTGAGETGTVTFLDDGTSIGTGSVSNGQATADHHGPCRWAPTS